MPKKNSISSIAKPALRKIKKMSASSEKEYGKAAEHSVVQQDPDMIV